MKCVVSTASTTDSQGSTSASPEAVSNAAIQSSNGRKKRYQVTCTCGRLAFPHRQTTACQHYEELSDPYNLGKCWEDAEAERVAVPRFGEI